MGSDAFGDLMGRVDPPLIVVTTASGGEYAGCLVGFHSQSSIDPDGYCVWLSKANHTYRIALGAERFAIHFLGADDLALAERFGCLTGEDTDKFAGLDVRVESGVPTLALSHRLLVDRVALLDDGGDHVCLTTRVRSTYDAGAFVPLRVSDAAHLTPGHSSDERAV